MRCGRFRLAGAAGWAAKPVAGETAGRRRSMWFWVATLMLAVLTRRRSAAMALARECFVRGCLPADGGYGARFGGCTADFLIRR